MTNDEEKSAAKLEPCPFCGSSKIGHEYIPGGIRCFCADCGARGPGGRGINFIDGEMAEMKWNYRQGKNGDDLGKMEGEVS